MAKLLIVDDDPQSQYMAKMLFETNDYQVVTADNGAEALEKARSDLPDLIISDILMPVMDGFALCREWKLDEQLQTVPFVFYTATYTDPEDEDFALSLGADRFLVKPIPPEELLPLIQAVLEQSEGSCATPPKDMIATEDVYLKKYNQTLVHKLESKVSQLEAANKTLENEIQERQRAEDDMRRLERRLIQSQKMEAIGTLAGGIAHDFNNILMAIMGLVDISLVFARDGKSPERHLQEVIDSCKRAKELVAQILTFSRQSDIEYQPIKIITIVKEVLKMLRSSLPSTIVIEQSLKSDSVIMANPTQMYQVLMNLCTNAAQAMKDGHGKIFVAVSDVDLSDDFVAQHDDMKPGAYLKLEVTDEGVGMAPELTRRIFEPYFTTKEKGEGTGLGLAVVHGIVKDSGGTISARSEPGKGATFNLFFPVVETKPDKKRSAARLPTGGQEHLLLVDDESVLVKTGAEYLERLGYRVTAFKDSRAALKDFCTRPADYDLVITDMTMPGLTGDRLTRQLLQIRSDLPVILCTGFNNAINREEADRIGVKSYMRKPFSMSELSKNIRRVLDSSYSKNR